MLLQPWDPATGVTQVAVVLDPTLGHEGMVCSFLLAILLSCCWCEMQRSRGLRGCLCVVLLPLGGLHTAPEDHSLVSNKRILAIPEIILRSQLF